MGTSNALHAPKKAGTFCKLLPQYPTMYEGDFNGALKLLLGRRLMRHADEHQINSDETYGGRKGRNCHELLARIQYTSEYSRIMRKHTALLDVDAKGCFDRMQGNVTAMTNRR